jgi:hypothetical protein
MHFIDGTAFLTAQQINGLYVLRQAPSTLSLPGPPMTYFETGICQPCGTTIEDEGENPRV